MNMKKTLVLGLGCFTATMTHASITPATVVSIDGDVKIFSYPSKNPDGPSPRALYEGEYYSVHDAKIGEKVGKGNIVRANPGGKAKVVYDNGDQFNVGGGTAYKITWDENGKTDMNLMYGKVRAVVSKTGPLSGKLFIRTKSAVMGVRGTDLFVADDGSMGTEVSVLRGKVEVAKKAKEGSTEAPKKVEIKQGETVTVEQAAKKVEVTKTTKEELKAIVSSTTTKTVSASELKEVVKSDADIEKIKELEKKAVDSTLQDIKNYDSKLYNELKGKNIASVADVNTQVAEKLSVVAPSAPKKRKPFRAELENLGGDAYKRYFNE